VIGEKIRFKREELGLTQEELATKMGYKSKSTINKIEMGINDITQSKIVAFAKALRTTPAYLMGWKEAEIKEDAVDGLEEEWTPGELKEIEEFKNYLRSKLKDV